MKRRFQSRVSIRVNASAIKVWEINDDISLIPQYHPEVGKVDLLSGQSKRAAGVKHLCSILEGRKGTCTEEVVDYIPNKKLSTAMTQDSWGLYKMLADFIVDTSLEPVDDNSCYLQFEAYYNPIGLRNKILNFLILKRAFRKRSKSVMEDIKRRAEAH